MDKFREQSENYKRQIEKGKVSINNVRKSYGLRSVARR